MKIKDLIKILEQFNPDGEVVMVYDCQAEGLMPSDISVYNGKMPLIDSTGEEYGKYLILSDQEEKNIMGDINTKSCSGLIIENK